MHVESSPRTHCNSIKSTLIILSLLSPLQSGASAQSIPSFNGNPIVGGSTLDLIKPPKADKTEYQFPNGFNCRVDGGDVPSLVVYGDKGGLDNSVYGLSGSRAGVAVILPLYQSKRDTCLKAVEAQNMLDSLELAERLVSSGVMTNEEYIELARKVKTALMERDP